MARWRWRAWLLPCFLSASGVNQRIGCSCVSQLAFGVFAINYAALGVLPLADERRAYAFAVRLVAFVVILIGVALKDRELADRATSDRPDRADFE